MRPVVSIIVPVYNAERYLSDCIRSLQTQTLRNIEIIMIDDHSSDQSLEIIRKAESEDLRIQVIAFLTNKGVSAARNAGLDRAKGEFIGFCDADDTVEPEMFETLYKAAVSSRSECSFCRVFKDKPSGIEDIPLGFPDGTQFNQPAIQCALIPAMLALPNDGDGLPLSGYTPRNLFKKELVGTHRFREDIKYAEDLLFIVSCLKEAKRTIAVDKAYYHYRFHPDSATKRYNANIPESPERSNQAITDLLKDSRICMRRMRIRKRKMAVEAVKNYCAIGNPYTFLERVQRVKAYLKREDIQALYQDDHLNLRSLDRRVYFKYKLMIKQEAWLLTLLFSTLYKTKVR